VCGAEGAESGKLEATCESEVPTTVTDNHGVASVVMSWSGNNVSSGSQPMSGNGSTYTATLGPFAPFRNLQSTTVTVTVTAQDAVSNQSTRMVDVVVDSGCIV